MFIEERIPDSIFENLQYKRKQVTDIEAEMVGYSIVGASPCVSFYREDSHEPIADAFFIYLDKPEESNIKVIMLDAEFIYMDEEQQRNASPIELNVAYIPKSSLS